MDIKHLSLFLIAAGLLACGAKDPATQGEEPENPAGPETPAAVQWPNAPGGFDFGLAPGEPRTAQILSDVLKEQGIEGKTDYRDVKEPVTCDGVTYGPGASFWGDRFALNSSRVGGTGAFIADGDIPTHNYISFKINRPGSVHFSPRAQAAYEFKLLLVKKVGEATTAKVVCSYTPGAFSNDAADRDKPEIRATLSVSAEDLEGITEPATVYLYHGTKSGATSGGSVGYYPITWTCSPDNPPLDGRIPKFLLAGDSTCRNYKESEAPQAGWGQYLADALGGIATVNNHAIGGYSTKRFIIDGYWDKLCAEIVKGDIVIIQFGHNDFSTQDVKHTVPYGPSDEPYGSFQDNLRKMVADVKAKGGLPILSTSTTQCQFSGSNPLPTVGEYPASMRQVASEDEILLIDINTTMMDWLKRVGEAGAEPYYILDKKGGKDRVHITHEGAKLVATWVAQGLVDLRVWHHPIVDLTQAQE